MKNLLYTILASGTLTPAAVAFIDNKIRLSGRLMNSLSWLLIVLAICIIGLIIWMIHYRNDSKRRIFGICCIVLAVISMLASSPSVIK
jgi:membrane-bound ClpP family serine protease